MKKVLVIVCVIVMAATANAYASPAVDSYIQAIASLASPKSMIPKAPKGYGALQDERTGTFLILVPREYCETNASGDVVSLGYTTYGTQLLAIARNSRELMVGQRIATCGLIAGFSYTVGSAANWYSVFAAAIVAIISIANRNGAFDRW